MVIFMAYKNKFMFKNPFSFNGRINRQEYALSTIVSFILVVGISMGSDTYEFDYKGIFLLFIFITYLWFNFSQGTKRSHDLNNHGMMLLIPFYGLALLFTEGDKKENQYGLPPNDVISINFKNSFKTINLLSSIQILLPFILLNTILIVLVIQLDNDGLLHKFIIYLSIIFSYFLGLIFLKKEQKQHYMLLQILYSFILFGFLRIYFTIFLKYSFSFSMLFIELLLSFIPFGLTFVSKHLFSSFLKKTTSIEKI